MEIGYSSSIAPGVVDDQSHLTQVVVGCDEEEEPGESLPAEEILEQVRWVVW